MDQRSQKIAFLILELRFWLSFEFRLKFWREVVSFPFIRNFVSRLECNPTGKKITSPWLLGVLSRQQTVRKKMLSAQGGSNAQEEEELTTYSLLRY